MGGERDAGAGTVRLQETAGSDPRETDLPNGPEAAGGSAKTDAGSAGDAAAQGGENVSDAAYAAGHAGGDSGSATGAAGSGDSTGAAGSGGASTGAGGSGAAGSGGRSGSGGVPAGTGGSSGRAAGSGGSAGDGSCSEAGGVVWSSNGHCYFPLSAQSSWSVSRDNCNHASAHLVTISSAEEQGFVATVSGSNASWIGLAKFGAPSFSWNNGEALSYTNWASSEPNQSGEAAVALHDDTHAWFDDAVSALHAAVCERP